MQQRHVTQQDEERWAPLVVEADARAAERWQALLDDAEIASEVTIEDPARVAPGSQLLPGYLPAMTPNSMFAYVVRVPSESREAAARVLIDHGWDGGGRRRQSSGAGIGIRAALIALAAGAVAVAVARALQG